MPNYFYEIHQMDDRQLPFIFHRDHIAPTELNISRGFNWHTNLEILCIISGDGFIKCGNRSHRATVGDIIIINSDIMHSSFTECDNFEYYCLIVDAGFCKENGFDTEKTVFEEKINDSEISVLFNRVVGSFEKTLTAYTPSAIARCRIAVTALLAELYDRHLYSNQEDSQQEKQSMYYVKKAMVYISENISKQINLEDIADYTGISKFYLSRLFKVYTGHTIFTHINIIRCKSAEALISSGMTVSEAAVQCGFENMSYFSRTFKKLMGVLPSEINSRR